MMCPPSFSSSGMNGRGSGVARSRFSGLLPEFYRRYAPALKAAAVRIMQGMLPEEKAAKMRVAVSFEFPRHRNGGAE